MAVRIEADAAALAAVPADHVRISVRQQVRGAHHAVPIVVILVRIGRSDHLDAREMPRHHREIRQDRRRHAFDHDVAPKA